MGDALWRWVDVDGVESELDLASLKALLEDGSLSEHVLVWKQGWSEWLPAKNVQLLADAIPQGRRGIPMQPHTYGSPKSPPTPKLERYKTAVPPDARLTRRSQNPSTLPPKPARLGGTAAPAVASAVGTPVVLINDESRPMPRKPLPTLTDEQHNKGPGETLRPAGAVPPPPRAFPNVMAPPAAGEFEFAHSTRPGSMRPVQDTLVESAPRFTPPPPVSRPAILPELDDDIAFPSEPPTEPWLGSESSPLAGPPAPSAHSRGDSGKGAAPALGRASSQRRTVVFTSVVALTLLAAGALFLRRGQPTVSGPVAVASAPKGANVDTENQLPKCQIVAPAKRLFAKAAANIPLSFSDGQTASGKVAIGIAEDATTARGILLEPSSLAIESLYEKQVQSKIVGVIPNVNAKGVSFAVDDDTQNLSAMRTIRPGLRIGKVDKSIVKLTGEGPSEVLWQLTSAENVTTPRIALTANQGYAVSFRQESKLHVGWLSPAGQASSVLGSVTTQTPEVGSPTIAVNKDSITVAYAGRANSTAEWRIYLAGAKLGELPMQSQLLAKSGGHTSPSLIGVDSGWIVAYTEGAAGSRSVVAQVLDSSLTPAGDSVRLSPFGTDAGQSALWIHHATVVSLFLVKIEGGFELWGTTLNCG